MCISQDQFLCQITRSNATKIFPAAQRNSLHFYSLHLQLGNFVGASFIRCKPLGLHVGKAAPRRHVDAGALHRSSNSTADHSHHLLHLLRPSYVYLRENIQQRRVPAACPGYCKLSGYRGFNYVPHSACFHVYVFVPPRRAPAVSLPFRFANSCNYSNTYTR